MVLMKSSSALLYYTLQLTFTTTVRSMTTTITNRATVVEKTYSCSDGVKLATRHWTNFDASTPTPPTNTRKVLCLHGWLDNAASFNRLCPLLLNDSSRSSSSSAVPTEMVALDFPGHGLSAHKSVDGPPQLLAEYAYYVAELVEALGWGGQGVGASVGVSRTVVGNINSSTNNDGNKNKQSTSSNSNIENKTANDNNDNNNDKIILMGHSMGSGVSTVLCAAFPEWFSALILLEGGLVARNANDASRHVRAACQRRLKSNRTLFPNANGAATTNGESATTAAPTRARVYSSLDAAIEARLSTTRRMPGDQFLSYEAARDMVLRATVPANNVPPSSSIPPTQPSEDEPIVFRHDPRLQWPSLQYYTREQVETFFRDVCTSQIPVCYLHAADGWPADAWAASVIKDVLKPGHFKMLSGSHHFHADPDSVEGVASEIVEFLEEQKL